ncbi:MAG: Choline-sulfatase [candidate division BRC1 bacterium ADurb.BinA364]|nr:MAG: Choline-sulfatase [candidate division BRC1 bacterium ADurb.BinA364]
MLFIAVDDMRPMLGCYGDAAAITPNIDALARRGTLFERAYCQEALCSPSRLSLLTGRRPDTIRVWDLSAHFRDTLPDIVTLPQHFKRHGYHVRSIGKVYHGSGRPAHDPPSWSEPPLLDVNEDVEGRYANRENREGEGLKRDSTEEGIVSGSVYIDQQARDRALDALEEMSKAERPFFLAVGFRKPHLPFCAPREHWGLYDRARIPAPESAEHPRGAPELAVRSWRELEGYRDIPSEGPIPREKVMQLRHGYYACVSYVDALIGDLIREVDRLRLRDRTAIVLWGDHGFHLGEQGLWTKGNNYEWSTRSPLIFSLPGQPNAGRSVAALVEFVDVYPTLAHVCGLPIPDGLEGISLAPLMENPGLPWKKAAFSQYPRDRAASRHRSHGDFMGYSIRTQRFRYVEWLDWHTNKAVARELYDHQADREEMDNVAERREYAAAAAELGALLDAGWRAALPVERSARARSI